MCLLLFCFCNLGVRAPHVYIYAYVYMYVYVGALGGGRTGFRRQYRFYTPHSQHFPTLTNPNESCETCWSPWCIKNDDVDVDAA